MQLSLILLFKKCIIIKLFIFFSRFQAGVSFKDLRGFKNLGGLILRLNLMVVKLERGNENNLIGNKLTMIKKSLLILLLFLVSTLTGLTPARAGDWYKNDNYLKILRITPSGNNAPTARQIVFTFDRAVVPLGKMERQAADIPINITPALNCQWRWLNTTSLACQLGWNDKLEPATRYKILVAPGIMTEDGKTLENVYYHQFVTKRPAVTYTSFKTWRAPGMPKIQVSFNQPVSKASVEKHLFMLTPDWQRVPVRAELYDSYYDQYTAYIISPQELLPLDSRIILKVESGIQSLVGTEQGIEQRNILSFHTFPKFKFLGAKCRTLNDKLISIRSHDWRRCNPLQSVILEFSSPVIDAVAQKNLFVQPSVTWRTTSSSSALNYAHRKGQTYQVWLPDFLKAYHDYKLAIISPQMFQDEFGRSLPKPVYLSFKTDHRPPDHNFSRAISVLEKGVDSEVPLFVTNLRKISFHYNLLTANGWTTQKRKIVSLPKVQDISYKIPLGIRDLIGKPTGIVQGYFRTKPDVNNQYASNYNWFFSQVTPFYVQAKVGHHNTLVWVMDFATGNPVSGVKVSIYLDNYMPDGATPETLAEAVTDKNGIARLPGAKTLDPHLQHAYVYGNYQKDARFFIRSQKGEDVALLPLDSDFRVSMSKYDFYTDRREKYGHIHTWGTTAQGVYKVGDTVQYKIFVRDQSNERFVAAPKSGYTLKVINPMGNVVHEVKDFSLSEFGSYHGEFTIAKNAPVGWYDFRLTAKFKQHSNWKPLRVLVSDFTPSPFRVRTQLNGELFHAGDKVVIDTTATLHAGGPYVNAPTKINAILKPEYLFPTHPEAKGFEFDVNLGNVYDETVYSVEDKQVNNKGELQTSFNLSESQILYGKLTVESAVRDDRGKDIANSATARYVGRDRYVGLKETSWLLTAGKAAKVKLLVIDEYGKPVAGTDIQVEIQQLITKASRVKGAGNAYLTHYEHKWITVGNCQSKSELTATTCTFTPPKAGSYKFIATIKDTKNRPHTTTLQQWAVGKDYVLWETAPGNTLEIVPEQNSYKVGEIARYLVKNPYPGAQALITIERFGTIKSWVQTLKSNMELIEIPVKPDYVPGFFVSVTVMSPRVAKPLGKNQVDLGKPAFRMGYIQTNVKDPYKELLVDIKTDKAVYRPREPVTIDLHAKPRNGETQEPIELAVTVLDESVFDLLKRGRNTFDPYKGFYKLDDLDMANYSLLMRLVGRQKFEKKGANAGGDGGASLSMRSLFKFVSYWNPAIRTDKTGKAQIKFKVPDNLTGWRVLVMAVTPTDLMGLGDANFKVNQPIEIRPILPNQVLNGDKFKAGFTIINRTDKVQDLQITLNAKGAITLPNGVLKTTLKAEPYKRYKQWLAVTTTGTGKITFSATASSAKEQDSVSKTLSIYPRRASTTVATYGTTTAKAVTESLQFPTDIYTDVGGLSVIASPSVIGGIEGAFEYMRDYPYACWEQKLSKATMASHFNNLRAYIDDKLTWKDSQTLPEKTIELAKEYQAPNGGMAYFIAKDEYVSPYLSAYTALAFNWLRDSGYKIPEMVETKLQDYLLKLLRKDVMPDFYDKGMASTVRAVALAALAKQGKLTIEDIRRYKRHVPEMDLFGKSQFLAAALEVPGTQQIRERVKNQILAHADQTSGRISFVENLDTGYKHILSSSLRTQCSILSSLTKMGETSDDIAFKLVRNITQTRKNRGHWENTQENMFCMNALIDYARVYETEAPFMAVRTWLDTEKLGETAFDDVKNPPVTFTHKMTVDDVGKKAKVKIERQGDGRLYYTLRLAYSEKAETATAVNSGIEVKREYHVKRNQKWELLQSPMQIKTGELVKVDLYVSIPAPRYFVVVDDPVPGGLEPVNRELATSSEVDANEDSKEEWNFYHKELRHKSAIFYSDYLSAGNYHLSYVAQAIAPGKFGVMATHAEEMYEPDVFGNSKPAVLVVGD